MDSNRGQMYRQLIYIYSLGVHKNQEQQQSAQLYKMQQDKSIPEIKVV